MAEEIKANMCWIQPEIIKDQNGEELNKTPIMVTNSLTRTKVRFSSRCSLTGPFHYDDSS